VLEDDSAALVVLWDCRFRVACEKTPSAFELRVLLPSAGLHRSVSGHPCFRERRDPLRCGEGDGPIQLGSFETKSHRLLSEQRSDA